MNENQKLEAVSTAKRLADLLSVDFSISIFGVTIVSWHFPPKTEKK